VELHFYLKFGSSHPVKEDPSSFVCHNSFKILKNHKTTLKTITQSYITLKFNVVLERKIFGFHRLPMSVQEIDKSIITYIEPTCDLINWIINLQKRWVRDECVTALIKRNSLSTGETTQNLNF